MTPQLADISAYSVPRVLAPIDLRLDANEGPAPVVDPAEIIRDIDPDLLRRYPDASGLETVLAERFSLTPDQVVATAGADDALDRACRVFASAGRVAVLHTPTFEMIPRGIAIAGGQARVIPWESGDLPNSEIAAALDGASALFLVTPNNPTGRRIETGTLVDLCSRAQDRGVVVIADLAYAEYADEDPTHSLLRFDNVVVVRTLSKAWGLAGLRVGYALGPPALVERLRAVGGPYAVTSLSVRIAACRLRTGAEQVSAHVRAVARERVTLADLLRRLGVDALDSQANFVFGRSPRSSWIRDALAGLGIAIRIWPGTPGLTDAFRITCPGDSSQMARLCIALRSALKPACLRVMPTLLAHPTVVRLKGRIRIEPVGETPCSDEAGTWTLSSALDCPLQSRLSVSLIYAPGANRATVETYLRGGAARVLSDLNDLEELLP